MSDMKVFRFSVDEAFAKKHNEMLRDTRSLVISGISLFVISIVGAVAVWFFVDPASAWRLTGVLALVLFGSMMLVVGLLIPRSVGSAQQLYDAHPLAAALIAEQRGTDYTLLALVNTTVDPTQPARWALTARTVNALPNTAEAVGTKVPVVAVGGKRSVHDKDHWQVITPMPIAWGTPAREVIDTALKAIPAAHWNRLKRGRDLIGDIADVKNRLVPLPQGA